MRPAAVPPIVTSKKTLGLDMLYVVLCEGDKCGETENKKFVAQASDLLEKSQADFVWETYIKI